MKQRKKPGKIQILLLTFLMLFNVGCGNTTEVTPDTPKPKLEIARDIPEYSGLMVVELNNNKPEFREKTTEVFENYSELDELGRCGVAYANICKEIMPKEDRGSIGMVKPSGWHTVKYDCVDGKYLYNRCHLIGFQLAGENANEKNLITGTRSFNVDGMLPYENMIAEYVEETGNHVLYRVTPVYVGDELVARGVRMEAESVEDNRISFNVFVYNVQDGVVIDYATGESKLEGAKEETKDDKHYDGPKIEVIVNINSKIYHKPDCSGVKRMADSSKENYNGPEEWLTDNGYRSCGICFKK